MSKQPFSGRRSLWALVVFAIVAAPASAQERYVSASVGTDGGLRIVTATGSVIVPEREPERGTLGPQVGCKDIQISADGRAVGWLALYQDSIPLALAIYSNGIKRSYEGNRVPVWTWRFMEAGTRFAFGQETLHGGFSINYELRNVVDGELVARYRPEYGPDNRPLEDQQPPKWVTALYSP
jgi:hypothetical protein